MVLGRRACQMSGRNGRLALALLGAAVVLGVPSSALADPQRSGGFFSEVPDIEIWKGTPLGPTPLDEARPTGRPIASPRGRPAPAEAPDVACSFEEPVCVHASHGVDAAATMWTLYHAERALRTLRALGLPGPLPDGSLGGSAAHDLYLLPGAAAATVADPRVPGGGADRASAFTVMPPPDARAGCEAPWEVARSLARAVCLGLDAGVEDGAAAMAASYLASLVAPCSAVELAAVDEFQQGPERSLMVRDPDRPSGSLLFPWFLDEVYGRGAPGSVIAALLAVAGQRTPIGAWAWHNEPDLFDVLRVNVKRRGSTLDQLLLDFAIARAFVGSRSDGKHMGDVERFGDLGRVRFEWSVPYGSLPRRLAPAVPLDPTGMTYLWVDLEGAPPGSELTFVADWELPSVLRWSLVKVDKDGMEAGRVDVAGLFGASHVERTVVKLDGLAGVMVVGVNAGSDDRGHPYDPDEEPLMPHSYTVMFAK
jgi:hypothetical protein